MTRTYTGICKGFFFKWIKEDKKCQKESYCLVLTDQQSLDMMKYIITDNCSSPMAS